MEVVDQIDCIELVDKGNGVQIGRVEVLEKIRYACEKDRLYVGLFCMWTWEEKSGEWGILLKLKGK